MDDSELQRLFLRYMANEASAEEVRLLIQQFGLKENEAAVRAILRSHLESGLDAPADVEWNPILADHFDAIKAKLKEQAGEASLLVAQRQPRHSRWWQYAAAAAFILLVVTAGFLLMNRQTNTSSRQVSIHKVDIAPGGNNAVLTLANGTRIMLDSAEKGTISTQGNIEVVKPDSGVLTYRQSGSKPSETLFNTIATPRGGQYQVVLADGTKVWLNAASTIYFPTAFIGEAREVRVTGEAYFEVTDKVEQPFRVLVNDMKIEVLGTHFNVMAYPDEPAAEVALLEGAVKVTQGREDVLLQPGQQVRVGPGGGLVRSNLEDPQGVIAWTNNQFWFEDDDIQTVMRKLSRWYNVDVIIKGNVSQHFGGMISRDLYVSKVFEALQATSHIQYEIHDSTIVVSP